LPNFHGHAPETMIFHEKSRKLFVIWRSLTKARARGMAQGEKLCFLVPKFVKMPKMPQIS